MRWLLLLFAGTLLLLLVPSAQALPDLEPNSMSISPQKPVKGEAFSGEVWIRNNGDNLTLNVNVEIINGSADCTLGENCEIVHQEIIEIIGRAENVSVTFSWRGEETSGTHLLTTRVDPEDNITEGNEDNNDLEFEYEVLDAYMPNLTFISGPHLFLEPQVPAVGDPADFVVLFENTGNGNTVATNFQVAFYSILQPDGTPELLEQIEVRSLFGGDTAQMNITWLPDVAGDYLLRVVLDEGNVVDESIEDDNVAELEVMVRVHTPELTLYEAIGLEILPRDEWLEDAFQYHQVELAVYVINMDPVENATDVRVRFWDQAEGGGQVVIGDALLPLVQKATRSGSEVVPATSVQALVLWNDTALLGNHTIFVEIDPLNAIEEWYEDDNNFNFSLTVWEPLPDLNVTSVAVSAQAVYGVPSTVEVSVINSGALSTGQTEIELWIDETLVYTWELSMEEGQQLLLVYDYTWAEDWPRVKARADPSRDLDELDESNNIRSILVQVAATYRDIAAEKLEVPEFIFEGQRVKMVVTLQNIAATTPNFRVHIYLGEDSSPEASFNGYDLEYNESRRFPVWLNNTGGMVGDYNLTVEVEVLGNYKDENHSNDAVTGSVHFRLREYDLAVELGYLANTLPVNRTVEITVYAFNHGQVSLESDAMGAEIAVYINGVELDLVPTGRLGMVTGEQRLVFYWTPPQVGSYVIEAVVDPYDVIAEPDESDNRAVHEVNVVVEQLPVTPTPSGGKSIISQPLIWVPLLVLAIVGAGMFAYYRLRGEEDYLPGYRTETQQQPPGGGPARGATTFRYDPDSGVTYDADTGEVIGEKKKD